MPCSFQSIITLVLALILAACGNSGSDGDANVTTDETTEVATNLTANEKRTDTPRFDREIRKKGCELLTAELTATTFGIPVADLKQTRIMGCLYTWRSDTEKLEAHLSMINVHKSEKDATEWFANATRNKTAEEVKAEMEKIAAQVEKKTELDTGVKKSAAKGILEIFGSEAVNFKDLPSVGDEARATDDGSITVRVNNLTFNVAAYRGDRAPELDLTGVDIKEITNIAKKHDADWAQKTAPQRMKDGTILAKAIVATL